PALDEKRRLGEEVERPAQKFDGVVEGEDLIRGRSQWQLGNFIEAKKPRGEESCRLRLRAGPLGAIEPVPAPECDRAEPGQPDPAAVKLRVNEHADSRGQGE